MIVSWMTTNQCNLKCSHCYQDAGNQKDAELTTAEGKKLFQCLEHYATSPSSLTLMWASHMV